MHNRNLLSGCASALIVFMNYRTATVYNAYEEINVGPFKVKQPLPHGGLQQVSPFLLLHHAGPAVQHPSPVTPRLQPHPHRGFEPVTFLFSGKIAHKDSLGNTGALESGDVQWMTAGSGILHSEGPSAAFMREGGTMELIQLWVNLPRDHKMTAPKYQDIKKDRIPQVHKNGFTFNVVAGTFEGVTGPASTFTPIISVTGSYKKDAATTVAIPAAYNLLLYVLQGKIATNGAVLEAFNLAVFQHDGTTVELKAEEEGMFLLLAGEPINEPVASSGPFVMNYPGEIKQAFLDYKAGKMGSLDS